MPMNPIFPASRGPARLEILPYVACCVCRADLNHQYAWAMDVPDGRKFFCITCLSEEDANQYVTRGDESELEDKLVQTAESKVRETYCAGRGTHPERTLFDMLRDDDHLMRARDHIMLALAGDTTEDHIGHAIARLSACAFKKRYPNAWDCLVHTFQGHATDTPEHQSALIGDTQ